MTAEVASSGAAALPVSRSGSLWRSGVVTVVLLALWQVGVQFGLTRSAGAVSRGLWLWRLERRLGMPDETTVQRLAGHVPQLDRLAVGFYDAAFFPAMLALLVWVWLRRPADYDWVVFLVAVVTAVCFLLQLAFPTAPARLLGVGLVDLPSRFGVNEFGSRTDVYAAVPSLHVAWALLVRFVLDRLAGRRWLGLSYFWATVVAVVVTGNHTWLDCLAAVAVVEVWVRVAPGLARLARRRLRVA